MTSPALPQSTQLEMLSGICMLGVPELNAVLQVRSHMSGAEGENHLPQPTDHLSWAYAGEKNKKFNYRHCSHISSEESLLENEFFKVWFFFNDPSLTYKDSLLHYCINPAEILGKNISDKIGIYFSLVIS